MLVDVVTEFAAEVVRPAAAEADEACAAPDGGAQGQPRDRPADPRRARGARRHLRGALRDGRHPGRRGARARATWASPSPTLAPGAVATALVAVGHRRAAADLPAGLHRRRRPGRRAGAHRAAAALRRARARRPPRSRDGDGFVLNGVKSMVPRGADAELFVVGAELDGEPGCSWSSPAPPGSRSRPTRRWACGPPSLTRLVLDGRPRPGERRRSARPTARLRRVRAAVAARLVRARRRRRRRRCSTT